jgi:hypothetical protein
LSAAPTVDAQRSVRVDEYFLQGDTFKDNINRINVWVRTINKADYTAVLYISFF